MKIFKSIFLFAFSFIIPFYSMAWGVLGHRIVGRIAELYLNPKAKKEVEKLLGTESVAMASNWGDFIKSDSTYNYLSSWHYINLPAGLTQQQLQDYLREDTAADVFTKINFLVRELKNKKLPRDKQVMYLKLLIHFAGDIHQPLHAGHKDDLGANRVKLFWFNTPSNLHRIWDENLIEFQQLSYTEYVSAINHTTAAKNAVWQKQPISQWIDESYQISEKLYGEVKQDDKLGYEYNFHHVETVNQQLLKGGVRLAGILNDIYGK